MPLKGQGRKFKAKGKTGAPRNPKLIREWREEAKLSPSAFLAEMALSTEERLKQTYEMRIPEIIELLDMSEMTHQKNTVVDVEEPLFQPFPSEIIFQNFEAHETLKVALQLRNNDQVARLVKVVQADSPYFNVICPPDVGHKVAPGMDSIFYVEFKPDQKKDYIHEVICITEREKFVVPVKAIGARGILDFPDEVHFGTCPVKNKSTKVLLVRNIGNTAVKFNLAVESPYTVSPDNGTIDVGDSFQVEINFEPTVNGGHTKNLIIEYHTGENVYVTMHGDSTDINVRLDKNNIRLENTYITSISRRCMSITNRSDEVVKFAWKTFATAIEEKLQQQQFNRSINQDLQEEGDEFLRECFTGENLHEQFSIFTHTLKKNLMLGDGESGLFNHPDIFIEPLEGEIWPNSSIDIDIVFKPSVAKLYSTVAFCDVSGRETRLPLKIKGEGIGPMITFSYDSLDVENLFINSKHCYEIIISNKTDIEARFEYINSQSLFGQQFTFEPSYGVVKPGGYQAVQIYFSSTFLGQFDETFNWQVEGAAATFSFQIMGCVIGPTFHFEKSPLKFNTISYGFAYEKVCKLVNTSLIPMSFMLRIPTDGSSIKSSEIANSFLDGSLHNKQEIHLNSGIQEFEIEPSTGCIPALSEIEIRIFFTPLYSCKYEVALVVDVEDVGSDILTLPISAKVVIPPIYCETPVIDFGRCFLGYCYQKFIELTNSSDYAAKYELVAQPKDESDILTYSSNLPRGIIESRCSYNLPLDLVVNQLGNIDAFIYVTIFGSEMDSLQIQIQAIGEGPVLSIDKSAIDFGVIPVLKDVSQQLRLGNESLIPAKVSCEMIRRNSLYTASPDTLLIPPGACIPITVTANVNDITRFPEKLAILVENSQTYTIQLSSVGIGTTIATHPQFGPRLNIGHLFSDNLFEKKFEFVNCGRRSQQIYISTEGFSSNKLRKKQSYNQEDMRYRGLPPPPPPPTPIFRLIPDRMTLAPGQHQDVILQGYSKSPKKVEERIICHSILGNSSGKEKIIVTDISAEFIQPLFDFSMKALDFTIVKQFGEDIQKEVKMITAKNTTQLPVTALCKLDSPFEFSTKFNDVIDKSSMMVSLDVDETCDIYVLFDPSFVSNKISEKVHSKMLVLFQDHSSSDEITLTGDVYYPNLDFEMAKVDFGSVLNETEHKINVMVKNCSPLNVEYTWSFIQHDICFEGKDIDEGIGKEISDGSSEDESHLKLTQSLLVSKDEMRPQTSIVNTRSNESFTKTRPSTAPQLGSDHSLATVNGSISWKQLFAPPLNVGIEEVFDILPLYGTLKPSETQQFQFTFYGHTSIMAEAVAVCKVNDGPDYEIGLSGHASTVQYEFNEKELHCGSQFYDQECCYTLKLKNTGKVTFDFSAEDFLDHKPQLDYGNLRIVPSKGVVTAGNVTEIDIFYYPQIPGKFTRMFEIRVAHFKADVFTIMGNAVFPRITLSLPRDEELPIYKKLYVEAQENLKNSESVDEGELYDWDIQAEIDRLQMKQFVTERFDSMTSMQSPSLKVDKKTKSRPSLINYVLDFGHVVYGTVCSQLCQLTNAGHFPISFYPDHNPLVGSGFYIDLDKVRGLPGYPHHENLEFQVVFNPALANLSLGPVDVLFPIKIVNGPIVTLCLRAYVTMPEISLSTNEVDFDDVICGQCKVVTIQLSNVTKVRCDWEYDCPQEKTKVDKYMPMHLRKKLKAEKVKPKLFEVMPPSGILQPGQKINVQLKFMPIEETSYVEKVFINLKQSTFQSEIICRGRGKEPHIEFDQNLLTFGPILPYTGHDTVAVKVLNPCAFPVEFYSLEFDKQYLQEEKVIRSMKGFDEFNLLLLPPRSPGEQLPKSILDSFEESGQPNEFLNEISIPVFNSKANTENSSTTETKGDISVQPSNETAVRSAESESAAVGDLEITPVSAAIASYLGIDLSVEGKAARNRRGICIIVHGAPLSGKSNTAKELARQYHACLLTIDNIVIQAIEHGTTSAAIRVRELCAAAGRLAKASAEVIAVTNAEATKSETVAGDNTASHGPPVNVGAVVSSKFTGRKLSAMPAGKGGRNAHPQQPAMASPPVVTSASHVPKKLDVKCNIPNSGDEKYYSCVLPDDLLVELLAERFQFSDCHYGIVIDSLTSMFFTSISSMANIVLRAINNRKYIYSVTLKLTYEKLKDMNAKASAEAERIKELAEQNEWMRLEEMSEDEYNNLPEEERDAIDKKRLEAKREKMKKKRMLKEQKEREKKERELLEEKRFEEEKSNKKGRKPTAVPGAAGGNTTKVKEKKSNEKVPPRDSAGAKLNTANEQSLPPRAETSLLSERSMSIDDTEKKRGKANRQKSGLLKERQITPIDEVNEPEETPEEWELRSRFKPFEESLKDVCLLFELWDRTTGMAAVPDDKPGGEAEISVNMSTVSMVKKTEKKRNEKEKLKEISESPAPSMSSIDNVETTVCEEGDKNKDGIGITHIVVDCYEPQVSLYEDVMAQNLLPNVNSVMDGMGVGPAGPPIPPDAVFSVVPYPVERDAPSINESGHHYAFVNDDLVKEDKSKVDVVEVENPVDKKESKKSKRLDRLPSATVNKKGRHSSLANTKSDSPPPSVTSPDKESSCDGGSKSSLVSSKHRWVIPPKEEVLLRISFTSQEIGQFDQTLNFELVGTRRRYQLYCRGICSFPNISREPRIVFPNRRKFRKQDEIVHKKYILSSDTFEFGPLLAGKNRERYREGRYPENMEKICISNTSPMLAEVSFAYLNDSNATTFLLEPNIMSLRPGENKILTIWAYPKTPGVYEDSIVCCIKENPEPVLFKVLTHGVRPELELDRKMIQFDRVLLHRKETRTIYLRNSTLLPVCWKISGMENLGDDFSVTADTGVIDPMSEYGLQMHFRAMKPINVKKIVRLEVSDANNVIGLAHAENVSVQAEAYDVALDMSFPKGADGGLDFGTMRVGEDAKQTCTLKNKGRYEIAYHFLFDESNDSKLSGYSDLFTITPNRGSLIPSDRPSQVQVNFKSKSEIDLKDLPLLKCQIIEPNMGENGEVIASIPIKISAKSVYSKYSIYPRDDINFGAVVANTKKTRTFVIENKSEFDFRYTISKMPFAMMAAAGGKGKGNALLRTVSRQGSIYSGKSQQIQPQRSRRDSVKGGDSLMVGPPGLVGALHGNNMRLSLGIFTLFPASGVVLPGSSATITVDMSSEIPLIGNEEFFIDISERPPDNAPHGIEYKLFGEVCLPSFVSFPLGIPTIFEEHRIVKNLNIFHYHAHELTAGTGVFGEDENKFLFHNVMVGHKVKARFKISNPHKVPCDIVVNLKPLSNKPMHRITDIFDVEPLRTSIPAHSFIYSTVTFQPPSMQSYSCIFEANVEGLSSSASKGRNLTFDIQGDGNLPHIILEKPITTNKKGNPIIVFNKLLAGRAQLMPVVFKNEGSLSCKVYIKLVDPNQSFIVYRNVTEDQENEEKGDDVYLKSTNGKPISTSINVELNEICSLLVEFSPKNIGKLSAELSLSIAENPFEDTTITMVGECYKEEVTIENIQNCYAISEDFVDEFDDDTMKVPSSNQLIFGDCQISVPRTLTFTLTNHSKTEVCRFSWDEQANITFSPSCGHLLPNCAKDISATYVNSEAEKLNHVNFPCKIDKIIPAQTTNKNQNWDNRRRVIRWVDIPQEQSTEELNDPAIDSINVGEMKPIKKKIVEIESEPSHSVIPGKSTEIDLVVSVNCNHARFFCKTDRIYFRDTFMFQTRVYSFTLKNDGDVSLDYAWDIQPGVYHPSSPVEEENRPESQKSSKASRKGTSSNASKALSGSTPKQKSAPKTKTPGKDFNREESEIVLSRHGSRLAHTADGRPTSVMALAYDASAPTQPIYFGSEEAPFTIEPCEGKIMAGNEAKFTIRFSPLERFEYNAILTARIPNLDPSLEAPVIALYGRSILPWCHFELEKSDYIDERRNPELPGPHGAPPGAILDSNTKVIEFSACGIKTKVEKRFFIINPTDRSYSFQWSPESNPAIMQQTTDSNFTCLTPKGTIDPGKKHEVIFQYYAETLDLAESFWRFMIHEENISVPFLLVGKGSEPQVDFDRSHVNFKQLLIGHKKTETVFLLNDEDTEFIFSFEENSRHAPGHIAALQVEPMKGFVPPKSRLHIHITYEAVQESEVNFNLCCKVKKKMSPLNINVKAEGFAVVADLTCEDSNGNKVKLSQKGINIINFHNVEVNGKSVRQLFLENNGRFNLEFKCTIEHTQTFKVDSQEQEEERKFVAITPDSGTVIPNGKKRCQIAFSPPCKLTLKDCTILLKIVNGPSYNLSIVGNGCPPSLQFSFKTYDFGPCFVHRPGLPIQKVKLLVSNKDKKDVSVECLFTNKSFLEISSVPNVFQPGDEKEIEIRFYPRDLLQYSEKIGFEINGLSTTFISIYGRGAEMKVEVEDTSDRKVNLGVAKVNDKIKRPVRLINRSLAPIEFNVTITPFATNLQNVLNVISATPIQLKSKESCDVLVQFTPKTRLPKFTEEVIMEFAGVSQTLFTVTGSCQGFEVSLDCSAIPFGAVTLGSMSSRKLIMTNSGDIGTAFSWNVEKFSPSFSIRPVKGYISPGMEVPFEIDFKPNAVSQDIRCDDIRCSLENHRPLKLVLTGSCIAQLPMKETIHFSTYVRNRDTKGVTIHNKSNHTWTLHPVIDGEYWTGADTFIVEPLQSKNYELIYRPLTMTQDLKKHTGTVFFALPDGSGLLYNLSGNADPPKPVGNIQRDVPCKVAYTEILNVTNWLKKPQRFRVTMELVKPEKPDPATTFKGLDYIDVAGLSKKEYKVHFYAHKEGAFSSKITFKNEATGEYQYYYLTIRVSSPGSIGTIDLCTPVRKSVSHVITINNPLMNMVNFQTNCSVSDISIPPQLTIPPQSDGSCTFEYIPLKAGAISGRLTLQSAELGSYIYDLNLTASPAGPERTVHFVTTLGTSQVLPCKFINYSKTRVEYACKVESSDFLVEKTVNAASAVSGGIEVTVDVTFEPSQLGDCQSTLTVNSTIGGEYKFPLYGHCLPPKPQGPFTIKAGSSTQIPFKNIFTQTTSFAFYIDNPCFSTKSSETIRGKKTHNLVVNFDGNQGDSKAVRMGRLTITCARSAGTGNKLAWIFYLKGVTP